MQHLHRGLELLTGLWFNIGGNEINLGSPRNTVQPAGSITGPEGEVFVPRTQFYDWSKLGKEKIDAAQVRSQWMQSRGAPPDYFALRRQGKGPFSLDLTSGTEEEIEYIRPFGRRGSAVIEVVDEYFFLAVPGGSYRSS